MQLRLLQALDRLVAISDSLLVVGDLRFILIHSILSLVQLSLTRVDILNIDLLQLVRPLLIHLVEVHRYECLELAGIFEVEVRTILFNKFFLRGLGTSKQRRCVIRVNRRCIGQCKITRKVF